MTDTIDLQEAKGSSIRLIRNNNISQAEQNKLKVFWVSEWLSVGVGLLSHVCNYGDLQCETMSIFKSIPFVASYKQLLQTYHSTPGPHEQHRNILATRKVCPWYAKSHRHHRTNQGLGLPRCGGSESSEAHRDSMGQCWSQTMLLKSTKS